MRGINSFDGLKKIFFQIFHSQRRMKSEIDFFDKNSHVATSLSPSEGERETERQKEKKEEDTVYKLRRAYP